ncbi:nucleoside diphosphate-linked moiety X motif 19 [Sigmodon hispidus]
MPYGRGNRCFGTAFFLCCLHKTSCVDTDHAEVVGYQWLSPSEATERFLSKEIWLEPLQFYDPLFFSQEMSCMYMKDSDFLEKPMSTNKKTEEIVKEGKVVNPIVIYNPHLYEIYVSLLSKDGHVYPKNYMVNQSLAAHL